MLRAWAKKMIVIFILGILAVFSISGFASEWNKVTGPWSSKCDATWNTLAFHPSKPETIYIGSEAFPEGCGVFRTTDGGQTWESMNDGFPDLGLVNKNIPAITDIAISPSDPSVIYVGASTGLSPSVLGIPGFKGGVFKSTDGGDTWRNISGKRLGIFTLIDVPVLDVAVNPQDSELVLVGTMGEGIYKTQDGGSKWRQVHQGSPPPQGQVDYHHFVEYLPLFSEARVFFSGFSHFGGSLPLCTSTGECLKAEGVGGFSVQRSFNDGNLWQRTGLEDVLVTDIVSDRSDNAILYAATMGTANQFAGVPACNPAKGILKSTDGGSSWNVVNEGLPERSSISFPGTCPSEEYIPIISLALHSRESSGVFAAAGSYGLFHSANGGKSWDEISIPATPNNVFINEVHVGGNGKNLYISTSHGLYRRTASGSSQAEISLTISSSLGSENVDFARAMQARDTFEYKVTGLTPDGPVRVFVRYPDGHREEPSPEFIPDFADSNGELTWSFSPSCNMEPGQYTVWAVDTKTDKKSNRATQEILPNPACDTESMSKNGRTDIILLVDRTGSMVESGLITPARNVAQQFVSLMNPGDKVGVVSFTTQATVEYPLSLIDDSENQIDEAVSAIGQIQAGGDTSVGTGLIEAFRQVRRQGRENAQQAVILLSDAFENTAPWVIPHEGEPGVLNQYPNSPPVHAIALGSETDQGLLQVIADSTGGEYHFSPTGLDLQTIYQQISGSIGQQSLVSSSTSKVNPGQLQEVTNWISSDFLNSVHSVFWSGSRLAVRLRSPNGNTITPEKARKSDRFQYHEGNTFATYEVSSPEPGKWTLLVEGVEVPQDGENFAVTVGGQSSIDLNLYFAQSSYTTGQPVKIYGTVNSETLPVSLALLTLQVRSPNGSALTSEASKGEHVVPSAPIRQEVAQLQLYDDGQHGDGEARDGVYTNTFNNTSRPGSYIFKLKAVGLSGMSLFSQMTRRAVYVAPSQNTQRTTMFQQEESRFNLASVSIGNTSFSSQSSILFEAQGQGIAKTKLSIYDLSGRQVYESELTEGATLCWNKRNEANEPVANGVYLYQLVAQGAGGQMERSSIQKLAILR